MLGLRNLEGTYHLDPAHSSVGFVARHAGIAKVRGTFESFHGWAIIDAADPNDSALLVSVKVSSINSRDKGRDGHLLSADFFDAERYPAITYVGTGFAILDATHVQVDGDLTIRDVTRAVTLVVTDEGRGTDPWGGERAGFSATTKIDRRDFGLTWNAAVEAGGVLVGDEVKISLELEFVRETAQV